MAETTTVQHQTEYEPLDRAKDFWSRYNRAIIIGGLAIILLAGGYLAYKYLIQKPKEQKAADAIFKAQEYYNVDSFQLALNGDGLNPGFIKIIDNYGSTKPGNLARFYAGSCYLNLGDNSKAVNYLKDFSTDSKIVQARAYKLLGDAYAEQGKNSDALDNYKKAAHHFEDDDQNSSEYLFLAAYFAARVQKNEKEAIDLFQELKNKYPRTQFGFEADKYLAQMGVYNTDKK